MGWAMNGLIIRKPYIDTILAGLKTWEIRGSKTHIRGRIGLIQSQSKTIVGECDLVDCIGPLSIEQYVAARKHHLSTSQSLPYKKTYAWVIKHPQKYYSPRPYKHPVGAVIWVKL